MSSRRRGGTSRAPSSWPTPIREGAHAKLAQYGAAAFAGSAATEHFTMFDRVRRVRNRVQYDAFAVEDADVAFALEQAEAVVAAVEADVS